MEICDILSKSQLIDIDKQSEENKDHLLLNSE